MHFKYRLLSTSCGWFHTVAGLGEFRIRDLNDEINKLIREKNHWQDRIKELGGPDYFVSGTNPCQV